MSGSDSSDTEQKRYRVAVIIEADGPGSAKDELVDRLTDTSGISSIAVSRRVTNDDGSYNEVNIEDRSVDTGSDRTDEWRY